MERPGRKIINGWGIFVLLFFLLFTFFVGKSFAQVPTIVSMTPADQSINVLTNTRIKIQFSTSMSTTNYWFGLDVENGKDVSGTLQWTTTSVSNDTLVFTPNQALRPSTLYNGSINASSAGGVGINGYYEDIPFGFITKYSLADATPPTVVTVYPYDGMAGVRTTQTLYIVFSEAMDTSTINSTNITIYDIGSSSYLSSSAYTANFDFIDGVTKIKKNTPFSPNNSYRVTVTTNVKDLRGNWLKNEYQWGFNSGSADSTPPSVIQVIPDNGATKVSQGTYIHAIFSEKMDGSTINISNITLFDNAPPGTSVPIHFASGFSDPKKWNEIVIEPEYGNYLQYGHNYTVTIGTGVTDKSGNHLLVPYTWSFTVAGSSDDSAPIITPCDSLDPDNYRGQRYSDGSSRLKLDVIAWDYVTSPLTVTAAALPSFSWNIPYSVEHNAYNYVSTGDEGLSSGTHTLTFTIKDSATPQNNIVTFDRNIFIFTSYPVLSLPANSATGVSTTPIFEWSYSGTLRPFVYQVRVFDGPNPDTARTVWGGYMADKGTDTYSISIPADKQLAPNTTYYWAVMGQNWYQDTEIGNGETISEIRSFTTGGTPPPAPTFSKVAVLSDDRPPSSGMQWYILAQVKGPSPADIVELKVTNSGGFKYIFTEDDITQSEQDGLLFLHFFPNLLSDGTYTFTVTDLIGRTATANSSFTSTSVLRVDSATMTPTDNSYINTTTPTLSWTGVACSGCYYKVMIRDWNGMENFVYYSPFLSTTSITVPSGFLVANTAYKWRVEVFDSSQTNRSQSNTLGFSTGSYPYTIPIDLRGMVYADNNYYGGNRKAITAVVSGPIIPNMGPLPSQVAFLTVAGPSFNYTFTPSNIGWAHRYGNTYGYGEAGFPDNGTWSFNITDTFLNSDDYSKDQTSVAIDIVDNTTMSPANNAYLNTLTPTFSWGGVSGTRYYRIVIMDWRERYTVYWSARSTDLSVMIPGGVLEPGRSYQWQVQVFDDSDGFIADNRSVSMWHCFTVVYTVIPPCSYSITPTSASYPAGGGGASVSVTAPAGCSWTAVSALAWVTITGGSSGSGNGTVTYSVSANPGAARTGGLLIAGQTFIVNQAAETPTGFIKINNGVGVTNTTSVILDLSAFDSSGVSQMCISNTSTCTNWEPFTPLKVWTLVPGNGTKTVYVWFRDSFGNINPTPYTDTITLDTAAQTNWISIAVGEVHTVALKSDGSLYAWGWNGKGELGDGTTDSRSVPTRIGTDNNWVAIAAGEEHTVALKSDGSLYAWGYNCTGQLGDGTTVDRHSPTYIGTGYTAIATQHFQTFALKSDGSLYAWGSNFYGVLGDGTTDYKYSPTFIGTGYTAIAAGYNHTVALKSDGSLYAWGYNAYGELGNGTTVDEHSPTLIGTGYTVIAAGGDHTVALKSDGSLYAWGFNGYGQLGDGTTNTRSVPTRIGTDNNWVAIAAGSYQTFALKSDGSLYAWGQNGSSGYTGYGQLGDGTTVDKHSPTFIGTGYTAIAAGVSYHTVALKADGSLYAWGSNAWGQLGDGITGNKYSPTLIDTGYTAIAAGYYHTVGLKSNGSLYAWGDNTISQLGDGTTDSRSVPTPIGTDNDWVAIAAGYLHTVGLKSDHSLYAWGYNAYGELGNGTTDSKSVPTRIGTDNDWLAIAAGAYHTVGLKSDGRLYAWGYNGYGQLGDGTIDDKHSPAFIGTGYTAIAAGSYHTVALKFGGALYAWGGNNYAQLGDGTTENRSVPTPIGTDNDWVAIAAGSYHTVALKFGGALYAWGGNNYGQLGDGTRYYRGVPTRIGTDNNWVAIAAGSYHTVALKFGGALYAWGRNENGQLGDGTAWKESPVLIESHTLTLSKSGTGNGIITSSPAGINCGPDCTHAFNYDYSVTLTATSDSTSKLVNWTGCDSVSGNQCTVNMTSDKTVTANFSYRRLNSFPISVYNGNLVGVFHLWPGFKDLLQSATLTGPNSFSYTFDLQSDTYNWLTECRYFEMWLYNFGPIGSNYGPYTLTLQFYDGVIETYTKDIELVSITPVDPASILVNVNDDGSANVSWSLPAGVTGQYYQVIVRSSDGLTEYYRSPTMLDPTTMPVTLSANDLRCLERGQNYQWMIRAYNAPEVYPEGLPAYNAGQSIYALSTYSPSLSSPGQRIDEFHVEVRNGVLGIFFDVKPGLRSGTPGATRITGATVTGPNSFTYTYDLSADAVDMSTPTFFNVGWYKEFVSSPGPGQYTIAVQFSDNIPDSVWRNLNDVPIQIVANSSMTSNVNSNGSITFQWGIPSGVTNENYQIRIRSRDGTKEYYSSPFLPTSTSAYSLSFLTLRGLEPCKTYRWYVRTYDPADNTMRSDNSRTFFYNPFGLLYNSLTVTKSGTGTGTVTSLPAGINCDSYCSDTYVQGLPVTLTATPSAGSLFTGWSGACSGTAPCTVIMNANVTVTANFYLTGVDSDSDGLDDAWEMLYFGKLGNNPSADPDNDGLTNLQEYQYGTNPNIPTFTISASPGMNGNITPSGQSRIDQGGSITFTIAPSTGYHVADVLVDTASIGAATSYPFINVTSNHNISATFASDSVNSHTITPIAGAGGTISPPVPVTVNYGGNQTFTIIPGTDYIIFDVQVDGKPVGAVSSYAFTNVTANHTIEVSFGAGEKTSRGSTPPDTDGDGVPDSTDNCPSIANPIVASWTDINGTVHTNSQPDIDLDGVGDACDNCPNFPNADQKIPVWYKDADNDGYSDGTTLTQCNRPAGYKLASELVATSGDCNDNDPNVNPGKGNCPPPVVKLYDIVFDMPGYDIWLPTDGASVTVIATAKVNGTPDPSIPVNFSVVNVTRYPGKYTNDPNTTDTTPDFDYTINGNTITLTSRDFGGSITIHAEALNGTITNNFTLPKDSNGDGVPDAWQMAAFGSLGHKAGDDPDNDGLTNFEEYRGFMWGQLVRVEPNTTYKTPGYFFDTVKYFRTNPTRKDLFVKFSNYDSNNPFAIGAAFYNAGVDVHAVACAVDTQTGNCIVAGNLEYTGQPIGVVWVNNELVRTYQSVSAHISQVGVRDWQWATKGFSGIGNATTYGSGTTTYQLALDYYFSDKPYIDGFTLVGTDWTGPPNNRLDPITKVQDKSDNGINEKSGSKYETGCQTCPFKSDVVVPGSYNQQLTAFDIDNNGSVELPIAGDPNSFDRNYEYTKAQVLKHTVTHEMGHAVGMSHNSDSTCVMYEYSNNWSRDGKFSNYATVQMSIHNP